MKHRHLILLLLLCCGIISSHAVRVTPQQALTRLKDGRIKTVSVDKLQTLQFVYTDDIENASIYVFESPDSESGFVIAPADDLFPPVLGLTDSGKFDFENSAPAFKAWLEYMAGEIKYGAANPEAIQAASTDEKQSIEPLITTKWDQHWPYNLLCPQIDGKYTVTGCVATAMAQVMYYHRAPKDYGTGSISYTSKSCKLPVQWDFSTTRFEWDKMYDSYSVDDGKETTPIATLMAACGASVIMDYTTDGSGAGSSHVIVALVDNFGYNNNAIQLAKNNFTAEIWNEILYNELLQNRPVVYDGFSESGGHCFVLDGYDSQDLWHINWGWGGINDGYFKLSSLIFFNNDQHAIIHISPDETIESWLHQYFGGSSIGLSGDLKIDELNIAFNADHDTENVTLKFSTDKYFYNLTRYGIVLKFILSEDEDSPELFASNYNTYRTGLNYTIGNLYTDLENIGYEKKSYKIFVQQFGKNHRENIKPTGRYSGLTIQKTDEGVGVTLGIGDECPPIEVKSFNIRGGQWLITDTSLTFDIDIENTSDEYYNGDICIVINGQPNNRSYVSKRSVILNPHERKKISKAYKVPLNNDGTPKYDIGCTIPFMITDGSFNPISVNKYFTVIENAGVGEIENDNDLPTEYFNLDGKRVATPDNMPPGVYLQRNNGTTTKVLVR